MKTSFPKEKIKVLLLEGVHPAAVELFNKAGYSNVQLHKGAMHEDELIAALKDVHLLGIRSKTQVTEKALSKAKKLLAIGAFCIGTNQIDVRAATQQGVAVFNSPYSNTRSVAELVLGEIIMLMRRIPERNAAAHQGKWLKDAKNSFEIRGKILGIIGYGHIGTQLSIMAESLGMQVIFYDIEQKLPLGNARAVDSVNILLKESDVVSLHVPATELTKNMIGKNELQKMKDGSYLMNLSRGNVVDLEALKNALESGKVAGAAVDVYPEEPKTNEDTFNTPLQGQSNVLLTPHIGGSTKEAQENIGVDVANKLIQFTDTGSTTGSLSIPALSLPVQHDTHRILHIHQNKPGLLSSINNTLSKMDINIEGQYLKTNEQVGYVVLDIEKKGNTKSLEQELSNIAGTIRTRLLY